MKVGPLIGSIGCGLFSFFYWYTAKTVYETMELCDGGVLFGALQVSSIFLALISVYLLLLSNGKEEKGG